MNIYCNSLVRNYSLANPVQIVIFKNQPNINCISGECPTYVYNFDYRPSVSPYPEWVHADHTYEVPYVLGDVMTPEYESLKPSEEDVKMSKSMMKYWTNFAKTG